VHDLGSAHRAALGAHDQVVEAGVVEVGQLGGAGDVEDPRLGVAAGEL
jgi:hypothetical protein